MLNQDWAIVNGGVWFVRLYAAAKETGAAGDHVHPEAPSEPTSPVQAEAATEPETATATETGGDPERSETATASVG